jgi:hypothetical protein
MRTILVHYHGPSTPAERDGRVCIGWRWIPASVLALGPWLARMVWWRTCEWDGHAQQQAYYDYARNYIPFFHLYSSSFNFQLECLLGYLFFKSKIFLKPFVATCGHTVN